MKHLHEIDTVTRQGVHSYPICCFGNGAAGSPSERKQTLKTFIRLLATDSMGTMLVGGISPIHANLHYDAASRFDVWTLRAALKTHAARRLPAQHLQEVPGLLDRHSGETFTDR